MSRLGIVVIGRNEGERLLRCLRSLEGAGDLIYVDSGSTDGSQAAAAALGARVVLLDMSTPFTAARARNAGIALLPAECDLIQFVDGDCIVQPGWLHIGQAALAAAPRLGAVFGRVRELYPDASPYNWLCDVEWSVPPGPVRIFGGNAMVRRAALDAAGGYPDAMIAGEEPDLSIRMRTLGWGIECLDAEMVLHDAAMTRFGQWWRRSVRGGHACAELADRHRASTLHGYRRSLHSMLLWGALLPACILMALLSGIALGSRLLLLMALAGVALPILQTLRISLRESRRRPWRDAIRLASFLMIAKPAGTLGAWRYWRGRLGGHRSTIIEYKSG